MYDLEEEDMWNNKLSPDMLAKLNAYDSLDELIETGNEDVKNLSFDVEEFMIEHYHKNESDYITVYA